MKTNPWRDIPALLFIGMIFQSCSSNAPKSIEVPKLKSGEQMLMESQGMAQMGERWLAGQKKVQQGEEMVRQGQLKIDEGQRLIDEGKKIMRESEDAYQQIKH